MVKTHRHAGTPRHYGKNQKKHARELPDSVLKGKRWRKWARHLSFTKCCDNCTYCGRASGNRYDGRGYSRGRACFNSNSKHYMQIVNNFYMKCELYKIELG